MIITLFESIQKAYTRPEQIIKASWDEIAELLLTHNSVSKKEDAPMFNLWEFNKQGQPGRRRIYEKNTPTEKYEEIPGTIRRCKENSIALHGLVLDYDTEVRIDEELARLAELRLECVMYTTFRNTDSKNKFRVVLPFSRALSRETLERKRKAIQETFPQVDNASFSQSQAFYMHSGEIAETHRIKGVMLDPDWFEDEIVEPVTSRLVVKNYSVSEVDKNNYKELLTESLLTCSGLHYASEKSNLGVLTLVALCKSAGMTYEEYDAICWNMAAEDSSLKNSAQRKMAWMGWNPHSGIRAETREKFIAAYGGTSKFTNSNKGSNVKNWRNKAEKLYEKYKEV